LCMRIVETQSWLDWFSTCKLSTWN
jgi:hypothetical protein